LCAQCHEATGGSKAATSPWWEEPDGVLARVRGDAAVVREIIRDLEPAGDGQSS
jgi:mono/diheme cytochrome c family protein